MVSNHHAYILAQEYHKVQFWDRFVLVYINDIYKCSTIKLLCFADDTTAYMSGPNVKELIAEVNVQLKKLYDWLCCNTLSLNVNKTYYTLFRPPSNVHVDINNKLLINNNPIQMVGETNEEESIKFLEIYLETPNI